MDALIIAEAHLYAGVAKADGIVDRKEFAQIPYYAEKSQRFFDMMKINNETVDRIGGEIRAVLSDPDYKEWDSYHHLNEAIKLLTKAKENGLWQTQVVFTKNSDGFLSSAKIGGYLMKEARFIEAMEEALDDLHD